MVCAALAREQGFAVIALTIDYNQRHRVELEAARRDRGRARRPAHRPAARPARVRRIGADQRHRGAQGRRRATGIPVTYVPARNTIFLSLALGLAEASGARDLFIGVNALDYSGYPDCRPEFIAEFEKLANLATKAGVEGERVHDPRAAAAHDQGRHRARGGAARARRGDEPQLLRSAAGRPRIAAGATPAACAPRALPRRGSPTRRVYA